VLHQVRSDHANVARHGPGKEVEGGRRFALRHIHVFPFPPWEHDLDGDPWRNPTYGHSGSDARHRIQQRVGIGSGRGRDLGLPSKTQPGTTPRMPVKKPLVSGSKATKLCGMQAAKKTTLRT
jgi:hypothetical protein